MKIPLSPPQTKGNGGKTVKNGLPPPSVECNGCDFMCLPLLKMKTNFAETS